MFFFGVYFTANPAGLSIFKCRIRIVVFIIQFARLELNGLLTNWHSQLIMSIVGERLVSCSFRQPLENHDWLTLLMGHWPINPLTFTTDLPVGWVCLVSCSLRLDNHDWYCSWTHWHSQMISIVRVCLVGYSQSQCSFTLTTNTDWYC